jgi:2,4-dienoyl-CoA reductase-like NADH-dependent reductase (Old Yellow Enzyme family)/thioredoxin reductase
MAEHDALLKPLTIKHLTIRNRVMSTAHAPGYPENGMPTERYQLYHAEKAKGGIGLTIFGGSSSVAVDSPATAFGQVAVYDDEVIPYFQEFADRVHGHGAALMCQITHMGRRNNWDTADWLTLIAPSPVREHSHRAMPKEMEDWDFKRVIKSFGQAARRCKDGGLDGIELLFGAQHLIDQFHTPMVNQRTDNYGGNLENRMRFGLEVLEEVRRVVGDDFIVGARMTGDELDDGGYGLDEGIKIAQTLAKTGMVDFLNVFHSHTADHMGVAVMMPNMSFPVAPFVYMASAIKAEVDVPVFHAGRITDVASASRAVEEGHIDMVAMVRAHMADPYVVSKMQEGRSDDIRQCVGANYCIDRVLMGGSALCVQNPVTGREATMPNVITKGETRRKVVVAGAGPGGLEAARVCALRGHDVVLFEAAAEVGGQINIAAKADWREGLSGITRWLHGQVAKAGVEIRLSTPATAELVTAEDPDMVIVATGGKAHKGTFEGTDLAVSTWDILNGVVEPSDNVMIYDDNGQHQGPSCATFMAERGAEVELATPDRMAAEEMSGTNFSTYLRDLHKHGVVVTPDQRLTRVYREGNKLVAVFRHQYSKLEEEREVDQIIAEHGTLPNDDLYFALKEQSSNRGELDMEALIAGRPQAIASNPGGAFQLFRVGDAVAGRNIHAAIYDSLRLCKDF